jgi:hypothetical protein
MHFFFGSPHRKTSLLFNNTLALAAALLMALSKLATSYETLMLGRFLIMGFSPFFWRTKIYPR